MNLNKKCRIGTVRTGFVWFFSLLADLQGPTRKGEILRSSEDKAVRFFEMKR